MIKIDDKRNCVGCSACFNICTIKAIKMKQDDKGDSYPLVDEELCIKCGKCVKVCPINNGGISLSTFDKKCYAAWNNDDRVRELSTSGGVFSAIAEHIFSTNGYVVGVRLNEFNKAEHIIIEKSDSLSQLRKAKYIQSDLNDIFTKVEILLKNGKNVLFSGTPCQVAGLKSFLSKDYNNLITIDLICHGVSNQKIFDLYVNSIENKNNLQLIAFDFRDKSDSWEKYSTLAKFNNNTSSRRNKNDDEYLKGYLNYSLYLRPACTDCKFKGENRYSDITLGDFWGVDRILPDINSKNGISSVVINTEKGNELFNNIVKELEFIEVDFSDIIKGNPSYSYSTPLGKYSEYFYKYFEKVDFIELINNIEKKALWDRKDLSFKERLYLIKERIKGN